MLRSARPCASAHAAGIESVQSLRARVRPSARTGRCRYRGSSVVVAGAMCLLSDARPSGLREAPLTKLPATDRTSKAPLSRRRAGGPALPAALRPVVLRPAVITLAELWWTWLGAADREAVDRPRTGRPPCVPRRRAREDIYDAGRDAGVVAPLISPDDEL